MTDRIKIAVRVRPFNDREKGSDNIISMEDNNCSIKNPADNDVKKFTFDRCIWSHDKNGRNLETNEDVFNTLGQELLENTYAGFNSTIFAYGQTGSGKSYSIEGYPPDSGLLQRICEAIFDRKKKVEEEDKENTLTVNVSYLEVYNEKLRDLLDPAEKQLSIFSTKQTGVTVKNLSTVFSESYDDIVNLLADGKKMRIVAATNMNKTSSRSHAVFTMYYKEKCKKDGKKQIIDAKINIVDLAGSERQESTGATGDRLKEGSNINKSLTYLGVVIQKLGEKSKGGSFSEDFVPYRNSQLTHLLSESLGGNSKTIMIAALSPASINYDETLSTLRFAQNVSNVKTKTKANINEEAEVTQKMKDEIAEMKKKIESMKNAKHTVQQDEDEEEVFGDDQNDEQLKELEEIMRSQMSKLHDIKKSSEELHKEREEVDKRRQDALSNAGLVSSTLSIIQDANAINLINICNDPSISNCLIYFMDKGKNTVGENNQNKIVLKGLGIAEYHAALTNENHDKLYIEPLDPETGKILVNGKQIFAKTELKHLDRLVLGHGNAFKVIIPLHKGEAKKAEEVHDYASILQDRLSNDTPEAKNMRKYLEEMRERLGEKKGIQFVTMFEKALDKLDEANEYSKARYLAFPLDKNYVIFTIEIMIDIKSYEKDDPEIAIRCRHRRTNEVLFLWSYEKFRKRLDLMNQWYTDLKDDGVLNKDHSIDPWIDINDEDVKKKIEEEKGMAVDKVKKLKTKLQEEQSKLDSIVKKRDSLMKEIEQMISVDEKKKLDVYIEVELFKRKCTEEEKELVKQFNEKGEDFKKLVFEYHTEGARKLDRTVAIKEIEGKLGKLQKNLDFEETKNKKEEVKQAKKFVDEKVQKQKEEYKKLIEENNKLERDLMKIKVEAESIRHIAKSSSSCIIF